MSNYYISNGSVYSEDDLKHYGVVGMKWGQRKAEQRGEDYAYTSYGTKRYKKKAEKALRRGDKATYKKYDQYHKRSVELDRKMQNNALSNSGRRAAAKALLLPILGGRTYEAVKASTGGSKYTSRGAAYAAAAITGPFGATAARALYVRGYSGSKVSNKVDNYIDDMFKDR